jgi:serine/threonine protein kinase
MEHADGGDLYEAIKKQQKEGKLFKEEEIWNVFTQMVMALNTLHKKQVFHRDMKVRFHFILFSVQTFS